MPTTINTHPLAVLRRERKLSARDLSAMSGVDVGTISKIENDSRLTFGVSLLKLARALSVRPSEIAGPNQRALAEVLDPRDPFDITAEWLGKDPADPDTRVILEELRRAVSA